MTRTISRPSERRPGIPGAAALLRRIATDPAAPLIATIVGPGGTGKSATLDAVAHGLPAGGHRGAATRSLRAAHRRAGAGASGADRRCAPPRPAATRLAPSALRRRYGPARVGLPAVATVRRAASGHDGRLGASDHGGGEPSRPCRRHRPDLGPAGRSCARQPGRPGARAVRRLAGAGGSGHPGPVRRRPVRRGPPAGVPPARPGVGVDRRWPSGCGTTWTRSTRWSSPCSRRWRSGRPSTWTCCASCSPSIRRPAPTS